MACFAPQHENTIYYFLGRLNNCNSLIQKLSTSWCRTLCTCTARGSDGTPKHPVTGSAARGSESSPVSAALCYHCCIATKPELALCHPHLCLSLLILGLDCYLHQDCMKPIEIIEAVQNIKITQQCIKTNECITKSSSVNLKAYRTHEFLYASGELTELNLYNLTQCNICRIAAGFS